jgi:hypothetical protein
LKTIDLTISELSFRMTGHDMEALLAGMAKAFEIRK